MAYFYSHLIQVDDLVIAMEELELEGHHKEHLSALADSTVHHTILELILSKLSVEDRKTFIKMVHKNPDDPELMEFLNKRIDGVEEEIKAAAKKLKTEMHEDIKKAKKEK